MAVEYSFALGAYINFFDNSSADNGTFILNGGTKNQALGGVLHFYGDSSAGAGQFTVNGGHVRGGGFAIIDFFETSRAGSASFTVKGGANGGAAGLLFFIDDSRGQSAAVKLVDGGNLNISRHSSTGLIIGSLEGDGVVFLGKNDLSVGTNDLSTIFSGIVQDSGSLTKLGAGTLKLTGANTYTGGTTVDGGRLVVNNVTGSGTGTGVVQVNAGALSGSGTITGSVTVGTGGGPGAALGPGRRGSKPDTLTIQSALTFNSEATYNCGLNTKSATADQVVANGVTVNNAQFSLLSRGGLALQTGTVLTVINNAAATPIAGAFAQPSRRLHLYHPRQHLPSELRRRRRQRSHPDGGAVNGAEDTDAGGDASSCLAPRAASVIFSRSAMGRWRVASWHTTACWPEPFELANRAACSVEWKPPHSAEASTQRNPMNSPPHPLSALLLCGLLLLIPNAPVTLAARHGISIQRTAIGIQLITGHRRQFQMGLRISRRLAIRKQVVSICRRSPRRR